MSTTEGLLLFIVLIFIIIVSSFLKFKKGQHHDYQATILSDKRVELQYRLRRENRNSSNLNTVLVGVVVAILILILFGKYSDPEHIHKPLNIEHDTIENEDADAIIE